MQMPFDASQWRGWLSQPDWYLRWVGSVEYQRLTQPPLDRKDVERDELKATLYAFVEQELTCGRIALGERGPNWDRERLPVTGTVLHHTGNRAGISRDRLSAIQLLKLYAPEYARNPELTGQPIWSNHLRDGRPVFWAYHWLVRANGSRERLLEDHELAWHCGDRDANHSTIAICLDGNFELRFPPQPMVHAVADLLREHYPDVVRPDRILGHCEVNPSTLCPGAHFVNGWKRTILRLLAEQ